MLAAPPHRFVFNSGLGDAASGPQRLAPPEHVADEGDAYVLEGGQRVKLLRARNEIVVRYAAGLSPEQGLQSLQRRSELPNLVAVAHPRLAEHGTVALLRSADPGAELHPQAVAGAAAVAFATPVLVDPESRCRMIPTEQILVRLADGVGLADVQGDLAAAGLKVVRRAHSPHLEVYVLALEQAHGADALTTANRLSVNPKLRWATPNFIRELQRDFTSNDPLFGAQQNLLNIGQNGGTANADVQAPAAWDTTLGNSSVVIAIIDDGVDTTHSDLRFCVNPGESGDGRETNGMDDESNGLVDDYCGWDFANGNNNPGAVGANGHGTACAGVAAAIGNNGKLVAGVAGGCKILPVKIADDTGLFTSDLMIGEGICYAASFADVLSNSWEVGAPNSYISSAIATAVFSGRNGKGCPVLFAMGNGASSWYPGGSRMRLSTAGLSGSYYFGFFFQQGATLAGENAVRIDNVCLLDADGYTHKAGVLPRQDFENPTFPPNGGWWLAQSPGATANWSRSSVNAFTGTGGSWSARSPALSPGQYAWLFTPLVRLSGTETLAFASSVSISTSSCFFVDVFDASLRYVRSYGPWFGVPNVVTSPGYPARDPNALAVGASTDCDVRADYSRSGDCLACVAPSNGGWNDIATLDPVGSVGFTPTDYNLNFGGTSAACALTAGIAALVLSANPSLTAEEVRGLLRSGCDKIGDVAYDGNGWNPSYGYGRVNAARILSNALPRFTDVRLVGPNLQDVRLSFTTLSTRTYEVQYCDSLAGTPVWMTVAGIGNVGGTGGIVQITDSGGGSAGCRYYRLRQWP